MRRTRKFLNIDQIEILDVDKHQIAIIMEGLDMENNVTTKRCWTYQTNKWNLFNYQKVLFGLQSQTSILLYKGVYRGYTQSKSPENLNKRAAEKWHLYLWHQYPFTAWKWPIWVSNTKLEKKDCVDILLITIKTYCSSFYY